MSNKHLEKIGPLESLGAFFRSARKARKLSQRALGEKAGVSQTTICRLEAGDMNVRLRPFQKIIKTLEVELTFDFYLKQEKEAA